MSDYSSYDPSAASGIAASDLIFNLDSGSEEFATVEELLPPGDNYTGYTGEWNDNWIYKGISQKNGEPFMLLHVPFRIEVPEDCREYFPTPIFNIRQSMFLQVVASGPNITLKKGRGANVLLGQLREALGVNKQNIPLTAMGNVGPFTCQIVEATETDRRNGSSRKVNKVLIPSIKLLEVPF